MKPNFLVIGAGRCGTTSLCAYLEQHPEVFVSTPKEPGFFTEYYDRGWDWYQSLFKKAVGKMAIGEGTNNYSKCVLFAEAHRRIARDLPDAQLVYIVRHPLQRIESDWRYSRLAGIEPLSFPEAICRNEKYIETSDYLTQIDAYRQYYADARILVLFLEDMQRDHAAVMARCFRFLGVDTAFCVPRPKRWNSAVTGLRDRPIGAALRRVPGVSSLRRAIPKGSWRRIRPLLRRKVQAETPEWTVEIRDEVLTRLAANTAVLLERYGKPADFWSLKDGVEASS